MKAKKYLSNIKNKELQNQQLKVVVFGIGIAVVLNIFMTYRALDSQRTIILPPVVNTRLEIKGNEVSDDYLKLMTRYTLNLICNYTPVTARGQFEELLTLYAPEDYPEAKKALYQLAESIETAKVTNVFHMGQKIKVSSEKKQIEIMGQQTQYMNEQKTKSNPETYIIDYTVESGKFMLKKIYQKDNGGKN